MNTKDQVAGPKPGVIAERNARRTPKPQLASSVADVLGLKLTAYLVGVKDTRTILSWTKTGNIDLLETRKLQAALAAITVLGGVPERDTIAPWFTFITDSLDDTSPAAILHKATDETIERAAARVLTAARRDLAD